MLLGETSLGETSFLGFRRNVVRQTVVRQIDVVPLSEEHIENLVASFSTRVLS
jgi:hypothetical protein